ncbi:MAG: hypothetical protein ACO23T_06935 [Hylemonella sp.]
MRLRLKVEGNIGTRWHTRPDRAEPSVALNAFWRAPKHQAELFQFALLSAPGHWGIP